MFTDWDRARAIQNGLPNTAITLQRLVMAMADYNNNRGKRSLILRRPLAGKYRQRFERCLLETMRGLAADGVLDRDFSPGDARSALVTCLRLFEQAFPNWQDAYDFGRQFLAEGSHDFVETHERLRTLLQQSFPERGP